MVKRFRVAAAALAFAVVALPVTAPASASTQKRFSTSFIVHVNPEGGTLLAFGAGTAPHLGRFLYQNYGGFAAFKAANGDVMITRVIGPTEDGSGAPCAVGERREQWSERIVDSDRTGQLSTGRFANAQGTFAVTACAVVGPDGVVGDIRVSETGAIAFRR